MQLQARLAHAETGQRVVEVSAWREGRCLGRCLGEASTAEAAEDRAIERLLMRLRTPAVAAPPPRPAAQGIPPAQGMPAPPEPSGAIGAAAVAELTAPSSHRPATGEAEPPADPDDWSEELAELERLLLRLGWDREQESAYLERAFGHPSRSRLIRYADLLAYLAALRRLEPGVDPAGAALPLRRSDLLRASDALLARLGWGPAEGRALLEQEFQQASRQQLSDDDLQRFNELLAQRAGPATGSSEDPGTRSPAGQLPG
jgi:hypothetical protein